MHERFTQGSRMYSTHESAGVQATSASCSRRPSVLRMRDRVLAKDVSRLKDREVCDQLVGLSIIRLKWSPAGDASKRSDNHNEAAQAVALTNRAPATDLPTWFEAKDHMTGYNDIKKA
ncbi:hypothetical protein MRX96_013910 [Rhipicephalus microplus]